MATLIASGVASGANGGTSSAFDSTGANLIVVAVCSLGATTVSDSKSNTYTPLTNQNSGSGLNRLYYCINPTVGTGHTITVSSSGGFPYCPFEAWQGASVSFDAESHAAVGGSTTVQPGSITPGGNDRLFLSSMQGINGTAPTIDSSFTISNASGLVGGTSVQGGIAHKLQTTGGAENPTWTVGVSEDPAATMAAFAMGSSSSITGFTDNAGTTITHVPTNHGAGTVVVKVVGSGTNFQSGDTWTASNSGGSWSFASKVVNSTTSVTLTLNCPAAASPPAGATGTLTITNTTLSLSNTLTVSTPTLAISPTSGATGTTPSLTATGANTLWANETAAGLLTESGGTGASIGTPTVTNNTAISAVTLTVGSAAGTLTITDSSTGATATFTANTVIPVTSSAVLWSPGNWYSDGSGTFQTNNVLPTSTYALSNTPGAYLRTVITSGGSGSIKLDLDTSILNSITSGHEPVLCWLVDGTISTSQLTYSASPVQLTLATGLASGAHSIEVYFKAVDLSGSSSMGDRWTDPTTDFSGVKITGVEIDAGSSLSAPVTRSKRAIWFGDSSLEGAQNVSSSLTISGQDAGQSFGYLAGQALGAEMGMVGFSAQGYGAAGYGNVPALYNATVGVSGWGQYFSGKSRRSQPLDWIICSHGINDGTVNTAVLQAWMEEVRAAYASAGIFVLVPWNGASRASIGTGFNNYVAAHPSDTQVFLIDPADPQIPNTSDFGTTGNHPNLRGDAVTESAYVGAIRAALGTTGGSGVSGSRIFTGF